MSKPYLRVVPHILTQVKISFNEDFFCLRMILAEELGRILSLSQKTFAGLLDSRRSDIVES